MGQTINENRKAVSADYAVVLLQYAEQQGIASAELLKGCNISQTALNSSDAYLSITQFRALLDNIRRLLNEPALALRVGQRQHLATHGALGYAIMSSSSLEQAMQLTCRYIKIRNRLVKLKYFHEGTEVLTQMEVKLPQDHLHQHFVELAFSSLMVILHSIVGGQACNCTVAFSYPAPDYIDEYLRVFQTTPQFNAPTNEIRFPARVFENTPFRGNPVFAKMAEKQCETQLKKIDEQSNLANSVYAAMVQTPGRIPSQEEIATQLNMSKRSITRKLAQLDTSFQKILNATRRELAIDYLSTTQWTIEEVAYMLDYESPSSFSRAFKKWTGKSPKSYRLEFNKL